MALASLGAAVCLAVAAPPAAAQEAPPRHLALEDYLEMEGVGDPRISPDGARVVYARSWIDVMNDSRESALWIVDADGSDNRRLVNGSRARWSPSGERLAFLGCGLPSGDPSALEECPDGSKRQVWVRVMEGEGAGTLTQVTRMTESASALAWSPDGARIALTAFEERPDDWSVQLPGKPEGATWTADPFTTDEVWWRRDRRGLLREGQDHIWVVPAEGGTPRKVTPELKGHDDIWGTDDPEWSPDGRTIYFDAIPHEDPDRHWSTGGYGHLDTEIFAVDVGTREARQLTDRTGTDAGPRASPDGRWIAYTGVDSTFNSYVTDDLYVMRPDGSGRRVLTGDVDISPGRLIWAPDSRAVYFTADAEGARDLYVATLDGEVSRVTGGVHTLATTSFASDGTAVGVLSTPTLPEDVVLFRPHEAPSELRRLTRVNDDVLSDVRLGETEELWFDSEGGFRVQGWVVKPPDFREGRAYPLILSIHGGPHSMYAPDFSFSFQHWAAEGYLVLFVNPRGSTGYGSDFGNAIDKAYPGDDFHDLMAGVDEVVARGWADRENLFIQGCSGGGTLTAWVIGHTRRFRAAAARCPIVNWISFQGTVDGPYWYNWFESLPWEDPSGHLEHSPLMYVDEVITPTLVMTGVLDRRTPISQAEEFYQALKMEGVPTRLIRVNNQWHGTGSDPSNFMRTQLYLMKWFEEFGTHDDEGPVMDGG